MVALATPQGFAARCRGVSLNEPAIAVFCSAIGLPYVAVAATMEALNEDNLAVPPDSTVPQANRVLRSIQFCQAWF